MQNVRGTVGRREQQLGTQRAHRLGDRTLRIPEGEQSELFILQTQFTRIDLRNQGQHGCTDQPLDVLGTPYGIVECFQQEGREHADEAAQRDRDGQIQFKTGLEGVDRHPRGVHDRDVVLSDPGCHTHLFHPLEQPVVKLAVGGDLAPKRLEIGAAILQRQSLFVQLQDALGELGLLERLGLVLRLHAAGDRRGLAGDLLVQLVDLLLELPHARIIGFVDLQLIAIVGLHGAAPLLQTLNELAFQHTGHAPGAARAHDAEILRLRLDPRPLGLDQLGIHLAQFVERDLQALVCINDLALARIGHEPLLGLLQRRTRLRELLLEEAFREGQCVVTPLQVQVDEVRRDRVGHLRRLDRIGTVVVDPHQTRVAHRLDRQLLEQGNLLVHSSCLLGINPSLSFVRRRRAGHRRHPRLHHRRHIPKEGRTLLAGIHRHQAELVDDPARERVALEQLVLGPIEVHVRPITRCLLLRDTPVVHHAITFGLDLQEHRAAVDRRHHEGRHQGQDRRQADRRDDQPPAPHQHGPELAQIDHILVAGGRRGKLDSHTRQPRALGGLHRLARTFGGERLIRAIHRVHVHRVATFCRQMHGLVGNRPNPSERKVTRHARM